MSTSVGNDTLKIVINKASQYIEASQYKKVSQYDNPNWKIFETCESIEIFPHFSEVLNTVSIVYKWWKLIYDCTSLRLN